jgi:5'-3' exonuclease
MTIEGIWNLCRSLGKQRNLYETWAGKMLVVDASVWFHTFLSVKPLPALFDGDFSHLEKLWNLRINQILSHGITPIFVFDGKPFPAKLSTNSDRAKQRLAAYAEANAYLNNNNRAKAEECAKKAIAITSVMIYSVVHNVLRPRGISYLVAPYEADGQIVALCLQHPDYAVDSIDGICFRGFSFV